MVALIFLLCVLTAMSIYYIGKVLETDRDLIEACNKVISFNNKLISLNKKLIEHIKKLEG